MIANVHTGSSRLAFSHMSRTEDHLVITIRPCVHVATGVTYARSVGIFVHLNENADDGPFNEYLLGVHSKFERQTGGVLE